MKVRLALLAFVAILLSFTRPACSQEPTPMLDSLQARQIADWVSAATAAGAVTVDVVEAWRADDRGRAFVNLACRQGVSQGIVQVVKLVVPRWRPDRSDQKSFFSSHTTVAAASRDWPGAEDRGWSFGASISLVTVTGLGRVFSGQHYTSDVIVGAIDGGFSAWLCDRVAPSHGRPP